nr:integrin alpha-8-like isoform X1 [Procambarus clarkii]XP_045617678.1 integrin alpha-8-like isoform X1 [Procambarus clarkii]
MVMTKMMVTVMMVVMVVKVVEGFNLHTDLGLVVPGPNQTNFGYSVALWHSHTQGYRLVVGAPRGRNTTAGNMTLPLGNLHLCDASSGQCDVDPSLPILSTHDKSQQAAWWGESIQSQGIGFGESLYTSKGVEAKLVACAPRYPRNQLSLSLQGRGACYVLNPRHHSTTTIVPFTYDYHIDNGVTLRNDYRYTGNGLAGYSVCVTQNETRVYMGVPNAFFGQGAVVSRQTDSDDRVEYSSKETYGSEELDFSHEGWATVAGKFDGQVMYLATSTPNTLLFKGLVKFYTEDLKELTVRFAGKDVGAKYGYSLAGGDLDGDRADDLVVGAPLAPGLHQAPDAGKVYIYYSPVRERVSRAPQVLRGQQAWGRFGQAVMCPGDLNQDGYEDVVVGAPGGQGAVYVFSGSSEGLIPTPTQVIYASEFDTGLRGFGFSLDGGLDVDLNEYPDIIIGSPESDTAVLIRSSPVVTLVGSVTFDPSIIPLRNKTCLVTMPGSKDVQEVTCFDLVIDLQYTSKAIRDDLDIHLTMELDPEEQRLAFIDSHESKMNNTAKISYYREMRQRNHLTAFPVYVKPGRPRLDTPVKVSVNASLQPVTQEVVHFLDGSEGRDRANPISGDTSGSFGSPQVLQAVVPSVLDIFSRATFSADARLVCHDQESCFSKPDLSLVALNTRPLVIGGEGLVVEVVVGVRKDSAFSVQLGMKYPQQLVFRRVSGDVHIPRCGFPSLTKDGVNTLMCVFGSDLQKDDQVSLALHFDYTPEVLLDHLMTSGDTKVTLQMNVSSISLDLNEKDNNITLDIPTISEVLLQVSGTADPDSVEGRVNETAGVETLAGNVSLDSPGRLGPPVTHTFSIINHGPSPVLSLKVVLGVPWQLAGRLPVFYVVEPLRTSGAITCSSPTLNPKNFNFTSKEDDNGREDISTHVDNSVVDPQTINFPDNPHRRRRRQADTPEGPRPRKLCAGDEDVACDAGGDDHEQVARDRIGEVVSLNCDYTPCELIICEATTLRAGMQVGVSVTGYAVVAALQSLRRRSVLVETQVTVKVDHQYNFITGANENVTAGTLVTIIKPMTSSARTIGWWHWLLILLISFIIILIIMAVLKKVGFFERQRVPKDERELIKKRERETEGEEETSQEEQSDDAEGAKA